MVTDLQNASLLKRIAAGIFDGILLSILAVGFAWLLAALLNYNGCSAALEQEYARYEGLYGVEFDISQEAYLSLSEQQRQNYDTAYEALISDAQVLRSYDLLLNLTLVITTFGILLAVLALEFAVPLLLKNGQTLGKKIFGIGLVRTDGVRMNNLQLFARTVLGKFTIETMIPVYIIIMICFNTIGLVGITILGLLLLAQIVLPAATRTRSLLHDLLAGTVAVDLSSQIVFKSTEDLIAYKNRIHAEQASRSGYQ